MKIACVIIGILLAVAGIWCMASSGATITILSVILGISMLASVCRELYVYMKDGRFSMENQWQLFGMVFTAVLSLAMIFSGKLQSALSVILALAAGLWILGIGINQIYTARKKQQVIRFFGHSFGENSWFISLGYGIVLIIFGILCMLSPALFAQALDVLFGIALILCGGEAIYVAAVL